MAARVCEALARRLQETERSLASADADRSEREEISAAAMEVEVQTEEGGSLGGDGSGGGARVPPAVLRLLGFFPAVSRLAPLHVLRWLGGLVGPPLHSLLTLAPVVGTGALARAGAGREASAGAAEAADGHAGGDGERAAAEGGGAEGEDEGEEEEDYDDDDDDEDDEEEDESDDADYEREDEAAAVEAERAASEAARKRELDQAAALAASVAAAQTALAEALEIPAELLAQLAEWERQQLGTEGEWRLRQSRMHLELEERKRRLQEQQLGARKKFREACDSALRPLYTEGTDLCAELSKCLVGKLCRVIEHAPSSGVPQAMLPGPLARIRSVAYGKIDAPLRAPPNCSSRSLSAVPVSSGIVVSLEKFRDRNGIAMLAAADDPLAPHLGFSRSRGVGSELRIPLRLLGSHVRVLTPDEAEAAAKPDGAAETIFVVRYAGGDDGEPIEPVQILPDGLSLADYDISFAAGAAGLRVEHRTDGPVKCRAEPAAAKQVFAESPVELYTHEVDAETHNIVQVYFSDLRDEVAVDVLNLSGTSTSLADDACSAFPEDATGAALNYKIIVRDGAVVAVLYQEGGDVRPSPFIEHRLPNPGSYATLPDGSLGKLGPVPRGLIVAREPRDLPPNEPQWDACSGLRPKGKHPAELPGMIDLEVVQQGGRVLWPPKQMSVPVCALKPADSGRLREWHASWDGFVRKRSDAADTLAERIEGLLAKGANGTRSPKEVVTELTAAYGELEECQRELLELDGGATPLDDERLGALQRGIQRFAALARFG